MIPGVDEPGGEFGLSYVSRYCAVALLQLRNIGRLVAARVCPAAWPRRRHLRALAAAALCISLAGCGFHLRGQASLPVETLYVPGSSPLVVELRRNLVAGTRSKLTNTERGAQATLGFTHEVREKVILSFGTNGLVREFQLRYRVGFRLYDLKGRNFIPPNEIQLTRDISFNEGQVLAKESEEALLYRDMQSDMVQQIIRRLVAAKLPTDE
jgi:LPS-assembly lipoprotein